MTVVGFLLAASLTNTSRGVDFDTEIVPVLTRAGCNAGACHGAATGRGGFRLSLFGSDAAADYDAIVSDLEGRRVNLVRPGDSLLLQKPTGALKHGGGVRLDADDSGGKQLSDWITSGSPRHPAPRLIRFDVTPAVQMVHEVGARVTFRAEAVFDGEPVRDVTALAVFTPTDPGAVEFDSTSAVAKVLRRGQHVITVRYLDRVVPVRLTVPLTDKPADLQKERRANFIDDEVLKTVGILRLPVSPPAGDATFLRRVRLDLTGKLPLPEEVAEYLADTSSDKRATLADRLIGSDGFVDYWSFRLAKLLKVQTLPGEKAGAVAFRGWLRTQVQKGTPFDVLTRKLITAVGDSHAVGPANFARLSVDARGQAELAGRVFMGVRLGCANCHNHPLDRWTQDDFHGLAAVFARLDRGRVVAVNSRGAVTNPRTGEPATPRLPAAGPLDSTSDTRGDFAAWLTAPDNPYFARAVVNRLWQAMFGRGLVEPVDDLRETNPATHPELLARLADDFVQHGYDIRHTLRLIAHSETYARSGTVIPGNRIDDRYYARAYRRPLDAEVLADALADVTGVPDRFGAEPIGTRAVALPDPRTPSPALDILGRCSKEMPCETGGSTAGLSAQLHQLNGELVNRKIASPEGRLHRAIAADKTDDEIIADFFLRALGRSPTAAERDYWHKQRTQAVEATRFEWLEDFVWALLSSSEFRTNH